RRVFVVGCKRTRWLRRGDRASEVPGIGPGVLDRDVRRLLVLSRHLRGDDDRRCAPDSLGPLLLVRRRRARRHNAVLRDPHLPAVTDYGRPPGEAPRGGPGALQVAT